MQMQAGRAGRGTRIAGVIGALMVQGALAWLLVSGLAVRWSAVPSQAMQLLDFAVPPPPPPEEKVPPPRPREQKEEGKASPPNLVSRATEVAAPLPVPTPPPIPAAIQPAQGSDATSGNAPVAGPGTGAGGEGNGSGSGGEGNGPGAGGGTPLRWTGGRIRNSDYPKGALAAGVSGTVGLRFTVGVKGRVTDCVVTRSSGNRELDETTCRLIRERFRYKPSRDARGRPYADTVTGEHVWELWDRPGAREED
jgi:periplasmic protein TonB